MAVCVADHAHGHRPPRLDGDAPEHQAADALDRAAHEIGFAGGDAARGDDEIVIGGGSGERAPQRVGIVAKNAEIGHGCAEPLQQSAQQIAVGVVDRGAAARGSRLDHFVAGGEDRHFKPPPHLDIRDAERGGERDVLRLQHGAGRQHDMTGGHVFAGKPPIRAEFQALRHGDAIALRRHVFLHEHRIGALGHRRAGENADGFAGFQRLLRARAGGQAAGDDERRVAVAS